MADLGPKHGLKDFETGEIMPYSKGFQGVEGPFQAARCRFGMDADS
jgi:hypothetical protein